MIDLSKSFPTKRRLSYDDAHRILDGRELDYFCFSWKWCAPRHSNIENADKAQETVYIRSGYKGLMKRINRVRHWFGLPTY
jgi:hypothetical protein